MALQHVGLEMVIPMRHAVSASEPNTPREFLSKKNCHFLVVERCVKVFSIRSTVHDMTCT